MIVYREWIRHRKKTMEFKRYKIWTLFGVIPLYIRSSDWIRG